MKRSRPRWFAAIVGAILILSAVTQTAYADTTIAPTSGSADNCWPFGLSPAAGGSWGPFLVFVYKNVPAFSVSAGASEIAFDLGNTANDTPIQLQIDVAPTTTNGGDVNDGSFTTLVSNSQFAAAPNGDVVNNNFELAFAVENDFSFPGGGMIIRFSNPGNAFVGDDNCDGQVVNTSPADVSGFFVDREFNDNDGVSPWDAHDQNDIGGFKIISSPTTAARALELKYSSKNKLFKGSLISDNPDCSEHKTVRLFRKIHGPDLPLAEATTNGGGNYAFFSHFGKGKFYTTVSTQAVPTGLCPPRTSNVVIRS